jgi:hypothetical protein
LAKVSATVSGGNFKIGGDLKAALLTTLGPAIKRAALVQQASIQTVTPVKTGNLRRSWNTGAPTWEGSQLTTKVGTAVVYARSVDARRGFVKRGLSAGQSNALGILREGIRALDADIWKRG